MLKLEIVTPEKKVFDETVESVTVPTATGEAGILPNHAPLISALKPGILSFTNKGTVEKLAVAGGFVEVSGNQVSVMTDTAESAADVNVEQAKAEREAAEKALAALSTASIEETEAERERLAGANVRLQLAAG
ncbi:MAG TPA: F0F1 ATP synthase subunit epsilon, partial [Pyrinomonadaceae bacterium]|nr:F0F1 ATP synthase subunit epsilon [Pyrinomonadaceae bacterium]